MSIRRITECLLVCRAKQFLQEKRQIDKAAAVEVPFPIRTCFSYLDGICLFGAFLCVGFGVKFEF